MRIKTTTTTSSTETSTKNNSKISDLNILSSRYYSRLFIILIKKKRGSLMFGRISIYVFIILFIATSNMKIMT